MRWAGWSEKDKNKAVKALFFYSLIDDVIIDKSGK